MRLQRIAFRGLTCFHGAEPITVDYGSFNAPLIALVGKTGAGKTTILEAVAAGLYKRWPYRPSNFYDYINGKDAFIELLFEDNGHEIKTRLLIDAENRKTEGYIFVDGEAVTTGRAAEYDAEVEKRFGSYELFLASVFAAQNKSGNLMQLKKGDRKALFVELLNLHSLEILQEKAKNHRAKYDVDLASKRAVIAAGEQEASALDVVREELKRKTDEAELISQALDAVVQQEAEATALLQSLASVEQEIGALNKAYETAQRAVSSANSALNELRISTTRARQNEQSRIISLTKRADMDEAPAVKRRFSDRRTRLTTREADAKRLLEQTRTITQAESDLVELGIERKRLEAGQKRFAELQTQAADAVRDHQGAVIALDGAQHRWDATVQTFKRNSALLGQVPCASSPNWGPNRGVRVDLAGTCPLLSDARAAQAQFEATKQTNPFEAEQRALKRAIAALEELQPKLAEEERIAAAQATRLKEIDGLESQAQALANRRVLLDQANRDLESAQTELADLDFEEDLELQKAAQVRSEAQAELDALIQSATQAAEQAQTAVDRAEATCEEARSHAADLAIELADAKTRADGIPDVRQQATALAQEREGYTAALRNAENAIASLETRCQILKSKLAALEEARIEARQIEQEIGDWSLLEDALGRDGIQALEIDAAGPEVARITNDLLAACYGPRFSISFETLRLKKSGKGEYSEAFDIRVYDGGHERSSDEALSGGQRAIVGEAISLALSIYNARKSGIRWQTLFRDETASALDGESAQAYVLMLRRALALGGFEQILFVSHQPEVFEAADVRLYVGDRKVSVSPISQQLPSATVAAA